MLSTSFTNSSHVAFLAGAREPIQQVTAGATMCTRCRQTLIGFYKQNTKQNICQCRPKTTRRKTFEAEMKSALMS